MKVIPVSEQRSRRWLAWATGAVFAAGVIAAASLPTGSPSVEGVVPSGARLAQRETVGGAEVLLVVEAGGGLRVEVAYRKDKGYLGVLLERPPATTAAVAWAGSGGTGDIPALSAVYGRSPAGARSVEVTWADGRVTRSAVEGGTYLSAREGLVRSSKVRVLAGDGSVLTEVPGP